MANAGSNPLKGLGLRPSQQSAKAEQIFAITNGANKKDQTRGLVFFVGSECWVAKLKMIDNRFQRVKPNQARKVPRTTLGCTMAIDYATLAAPIGGT